MRHAAILGLALGAAVAVTFVAREVGWRGGTPPPPGVVAGRTSVEASTSEAAHAAARRLAGAVRAYVAGRGCYPPTPWLRVADGFGVAPHGVTASWPSDQRYGAFDASGTPLDNAGTAYYVGIVWRTDWQAHGGGFTNPGYLWLVDGRPVRVCER